MDLSDLQDLETFEVPILKSDGTPVMGSDGQPWKIKVAGPSHPATFRAQDMVGITVKRIAGEKDRKDDEGETDEDVRLRMLAPLIERTLGWSPTTFQGSPFPFSRDNAIAIYTTAALIRSQVEQALYTEGNFRKRPSKPS